MSEVVMTQGGVFRGHLTRAACGLRPARSISRNITPGNGGVTIHYGGPRTGITAATPHARCLATWRGWQNYHMDHHKWADLAYTLGFCQHGYLLAGRGLGVRTAGQGHNVGNQTSYALVFIGGERDVPSPDAVTAMEHGIVTLRAGGAGLRVWHHWDWSATACPGSLLSPHVTRMDRRVLVPPPAEVLVATGIPAVLRVDGDLGGMTRGATEWYLGRAQDQAWDRMDVRAIQTWAGRPRTGVFDVGDLHAIQAKTSAVRADSWTSNMTVGLQNFLNRRIAEAHARHQTEEETP